MASGYNAHLEVDYYGGFRKGVDVGIPANSPEQAYRNARDVASEIAKEGLMEGADEVRVKVTDLRGLDGESIGTGDDSTIERTAFDHLTTLR